MPTAPMSVMTFNLRMDTGAPPGDPDCWAERKPLIIDLLRSEKPALLGVQEPLFDQLDVFDQALPDHRVVGIGVRGGSDWVHSAIAYDTTRFRLTSWDQQWLSDTPQLIGSTTWGNEGPRVLVRCDFIDTITEQPFTMINTHLDHRAEEARVNGAAQINDLIADLDHPVILTGDFNCAAGDSTAWDLLTGKGLQDSWLTAARRDSPEVATFHGYQDLQPEGRRIDWILVSPEVTVSATKINTWTRDGRWPSDHYPVQAELALPA